MPGLFRSLTPRLLLFNLLILFLPMGSILVLDTYENQLLASQENSMIQQGRIFASVLSGFQDGAEDGEGLAREVRRILENLRGRTDSRIRVVDDRGRLLADSASAAAPVPAVPATAAAVASAPVNRENVPSPDEETYTEAGDSEQPANTNLLYGIAVYPVKALKKLLRPPARGYSGAEFYSARQVLLGPEIQSALEGRYGAATRYSSGGQVSVNLYSAIPVFAGAEGGTDRVIGAVLVSRSSYGILLNLYRLRLDIIRIFFMSLAVSLLLSLGLSLTITLPIKKLKAEAEGVLDQAGHFSGHFRGLKRRDEIGDLSRSLRGLSQKLEKRIGFIERFTSDLLHELKNPLAAIRAQTELAALSPVKEEKLLQGIAGEESRMERLLGKLRELSRIDNALEQETAETVDLAAFIPLLLERYAPGPGAGPVFENRLRENPGGAGREAPGPAGVLINPDHLIRALSNLIDNALSFSPPGGTVTVGLEAARNGEGWNITVEDEGPGIREAAAERYFDRFYSERSDTEKENHSGLGLAIVRAIAEGSGGGCSLRNRTAGPGCRCTLTFPKARGG
jgi:two-component system sensor histidine kinase ChvG